MTRENAEALECSFEDSGYGGSLLSQIAKRTYLDWFAQWRIIEAYFSHGRAVSIGLRFFPTHSSLCIAF